MFANSSLFLVAGRPEDGGVMMDDLDTLQMELETLLNCVVLRSLNLQREIAGMTEKVEHVLFGFIDTDANLLLFSPHHLVNVLNRMKNHPRNSRNKEKQEMLTLHHF